MTNFTMLNDEQKAILNILRCFPPSDSRLKFGESFWRIAYSIFSLGIEKTFSAEELKQHVNNNLVWKDSPVVNEDVLEFLEKLERIGFLEKAGDSYKLSSSSARSALGEFFTLFWRPRAGRTGFMRYLYDSHLRLVEWCCIYLNTEITLKKVSELTGLRTDQSKYLQRLVRKGWVQKINGIYRQKNEEGIFQHLWEGYQRYQSSKPTIVDHIILILESHEKCSGKHIHEQLQCQYGVECDRSTVYKHLAKLEKDGILRKVDELKHRGAYEIFYSLNYENVDIYREELKKQIDGILKKTGLQVKESFLEKMQEQKPHVLKIFLQQIASFFILDPHENESSALWMEFFESVFPEDIKKMRNEILRLKTEKAPTYLSEFVKKYKITPAATSFLICC